MKLLLDEGLPTSAADLLQRAGHDAIHVGSIGMATADDAAILQRAVEEGRCVVTLDADFHALLARSQALAPSVIRIRIEGLRAEGVMTIILAAIQHCPSELERGAVVSVLPHQMKVRLLPLP